MNHIADTQSGIMEKLQSQSSKKQKFFFWNPYRSQDFIVQFVVCTLQNSVTTAIECPFSQLDNKKDSI